MVNKKTVLIGALTLMIPAHNIHQERPAVRPPAAARGRDKPHNDHLPLTAADHYYEKLSEGLNPRLSLYEEKEPVILVVEASDEDHKAEVIKVIESTYGKDNPPRIVYIDSNLLDDDAAFSLHELLKKQGVSLSQISAANFSMAAWFDDSRPTSALAMRQNIAAFKNTIFVHGAENKPGIQPVYGLTTQLDHSLIVGATQHAAHEHAPEKIKETDFSASQEHPTSAVDLVMKGHEVPINGISGKWARDKKDDFALRKITGTSFAAPQVTAITAKLAARFKSLHINGLPGRRYKMELTKASIDQKDQRRHSFTEQITSTLIHAGHAIDAGDRSAVLTVPTNKSFDTMGSGYGIPDFAISERVLFDQILASQLSDQALPEETYQSYAPENNKVYPSIKFDSAQEEHDAMGQNAFRYMLPVRVPVPLESHKMEGENKTVYVDIPPFKDNLSAHLIRGSLLVGVEPKTTPDGQPKDEVAYELLLESPDRKTRLPLSRFSPYPKEELWHKDKAHPIDEFRMVNYRTRGYMSGETSPEDAKHGWRLVIKTTGHVDDIKVYASGNNLLPVMEVTGVPADKDLSHHHPVDASYLAFLSQTTIVDSYKSAFENLEDQLDHHKKAQRVLEDFIEGKPVDAHRIMESYDTLSKAVQSDDKMQQALGLMVHHTYVEPTARAMAERLMHLAQHYEDTSHADLDKVTKAYSQLYKDVLQYDKALVSGNYEALGALVENMHKQVQTHSTLLADYARSVDRIYDSQSVIDDEQQAVRQLYTDITGNNITLPRRNMAAAIAR